MSLVSRPPRHPLLARRVECVWFAEPDASTPPCEERILPTCRAQMILSPGASVFVGPKTRPTHIQRRADLPAVGVSFVAGAASHFVAVDGRESRDSSVTLDAVFGSGSLAEQLAEQTAKDALDLVEDDLVKRLRAVAADQVVLVERAIRNGVRASVAVRRLGVDRRAFVPVFRRVVGVAPKHYERICRFNRSIQAIRRPDAAPLATIASDVGFSDQAHLSREINHFAGISPARLHRDASETTNHVAADKIFKI